jgi:hypothetical protein
MLKAGNNILSFPCNNVNKSVPYFREFSSDKYQGFKTMDDYLYDGVAKLHAANISFTERDVNIPETDLLPDGAIMIREASARKLRYNVQVNDCKYWQYHRDNGVTKIGVNDDFTGKT